MKNLKISKLKDDVAHFKKLEKININNINKIKKNSKEIRHKICKCEICTNYKIDHCINEMFLDNGKTKKLIEDLNKNNLLLKSGYDKLTKKIMENENNDFQRNNKIAELKINIKEKESENKILNHKIEELQNFISSHKNINKATSEKKIIELVEELIAKEKEIKEIKSRYPCDLLKNEHLLIVTFISKNEDIHYSLICKNTEKFSNLENKLYEKYPQLTEYNKYNKEFYYNGKSLHRFKNIDENKICNNAIIYF